MTDLSQLPPPPQGQTGVTLDSFSHLPNPPQGQQGLTLEEATNASLGVTKNKNGTYSSPTFLQGLEQAGIGAANFLGSQAIGLGKFALNAVKPSSNTVFNQKATPAQLAKGDAPFNAAIQTGTDLQNQMSPQNQAQQGGATAANVGEIALPLAGTAADVIEGAPKAIAGISNLLKDSPEEIAIKNITPDIDEVKNPQLKQVLKNVDPETTFSKGQVNLSPNLEKTAKTYSDLLQGNPTENYQDVLKESSDTMKTTKASLQGKTFNPDTLEKNIQQATKGLKPPSTISATDWSKKIADITDNILEQNSSGKADELGDYVLKYRADNQGALDQLYGGNAKSSSKLIDAIQDAMNKTISDKVPGYADDVQKMKDLKQLSDWLQPQAETSVQSSKLGSFIKKNKVPISIAGSVAAGATGIPQKILKATTGINLP